MKPTKIISTALVCMAAIACSTANSELVDKSRTTVGVAKNSSSASQGNNGLLIFKGDVPRFPSLSEADTEAMCMEMVPMAEAIMIERQNGVSKDVILNLVNQNKYKHRMQYGKVMADVAYSLPIEQSTEQKELLVQGFVNEYYNFCLGNE